MDNQGPGRCRQAWVVQRLDIAIQLTNHCHLDKYYKIFWVIWWRMSYPIKKKWYPQLEWLAPVNCVHVYPTEMKPCTVIKMVLQYCFLNKAFFFNRRLQLWQLRLVHWLAGHLVLFLGKYICLHLWWILQSIKSLFFPIIFLSSWYFIMENFLYQSYCFRLPIAWDILVRQRRIIYFLELCLVSLILFLVSGICFMS